MNPSDKGPRLPPPPRPPASSPSSSALLRGDLIPASPVSISEKVPQLDDPELQAAAQAIASHMGSYRDPEASIEIPPPAELEREKLPPDAKDPYIGTTFDHRYKIEQLLGEGGMGYVYLARH